MRLDVNKFVDSVAAFKIPLGKSTIGSESLVTNSLRNVMAGLPKEGWQTVRTVGVNQVRLDSNQSLDSLVE